MKDNKTIYQVDAFTDLPFRGNPAGGMIVNEEFPAGWMQYMELEMKLSVTAFLVPREDSFDIRYFTPTIEVPLCGRATLASAHVLFSEGIADPDKSVLLN